MAKLTQSSTESYLVRIYRRSSRNPHLITGLVEIIGDDKTESFRNADELMEIIGINRSKPKRRIR